MCLREKKNNKICNIFNDFAALAWRNSSGNKIYDSVRTQSTRRKEGGSEFIDSLDQQVDHSQ